MPRKGHRQKPKSLSHIKTKKGSYTASVKRRYGKKGFTKQGTIRRSIITKDKQSTNLRTRRQANLADTYRKYRK